MIAHPHNDRDCLDAVTEQIVDVVDARDPAVVAIAAQHADTTSLVDWMRTLPQRDDQGAPCDGPKVHACRPPQRLRFAAEDPNCLERAATYIAAAELIAPDPVRRLATVDTPAGLHTFPTEDEVPVVLDPDQSRNALRGGLFRSRRRRNSAPVGLTPTEAVDWIAEIAVEPATRFADGAQRVRNGHRALRGVLAGRPLRIRDVRNVVFTLALADREAPLYGPTGRRIVRSTARAVDDLDRTVGVRNAAELRVGNMRVRPNVPLLAALGRVGGRLGAKVGIEALRVKLATMGITPPVLQSLEHELQREGLSLGALAAPPPMLGSLEALAPEALAGRWVAARI